MSVIELGSPPLVTPKRKGVVGTAVDYPEAFANEKILKRALSALQRGPIRFHRNNVIACEGDTADYMFLVISGVVRHCKTFQNGTRNIVAFYLPGDLFGSTDADHRLSVEAAADAMVLFIKRSALFSIATRECGVANFLLDRTMIELRRAHEHSMLMSKDAQSRVAMFLTHFWVRLGKPKCLDFPMTHQDIADHLGLTIETLSRTITNLERSGIVLRLPPRNSLLLLHPSMLVRMTN
jgi:CRP/FNR family transcriptional regulator, nitrogen fixation regulation protein